jgi:DNA-binding MarR family transcriptional regulator
VNKTALISKYLIKQISDMSDEPYYKLSEFLDTFPLGFPRTISGVEIQILKKLFTHEEAELAGLLSQVPEEASQIAQRTGLNQDNLTKKLESMSRKGLIFRLRRS